MNCSKSQFIIVFSWCPGIFSSLLLTENVFDRCWYTPSQASVALSSDNYHQYLQYLLSNHIYLCKSALNTASFLHSLHRRTMIELWGWYTSYLHMCWVFSLFILQIIFEMHASSNFSSIIILTQPML